MKAKVEVLITLPLAEELVSEIEQVSERLSVHVHPAREGNEVPAERWEKAEVLYTMYALPEPDQAPNLRWVQSYLAGIDKIRDAVLFQDKKVQLTTMSGANASQVAEHVLTMLLALGHQLPRFFSLQSRGEWMENKGANYIPTELRGRTVGIIGYGSIGRQVARLVRTFGAYVLAAKRDMMHPEDGGYQIDDMGDPEGDLFTRLYPSQALRSMLAKCDFVVVTVPLTSSTQGLFGEAQIKAMKPSAFLVDVSRGGIVDHVALLLALQEKRLAGAALDVFPLEPLPQDHPFWHMTNVIITPHIAGFSPEYNQRANRLFVENLRRYLAEEDMLNPVDLTKEY